MRKITLLIFSLLFIGTSAYSQFQQFGSTRMNFENFFDVGVNPFIMIHNGENPDRHRYSGVSLNAGYGLNGFLDLRVNAGVLADVYDNAPESYDPYNLYFGVELEGQVFNMGKPRNSGFEINVGGGVHAWQNHAGFDAVLKFGYRVNRRFYLYTGGDGDFNFYAEHTEDGIVKSHMLLYRAPVGLELVPSDLMSIVLEVDVPLSENDRITAGGGVRFYFDRGSRWR